MSGYFPLVGFHFKVEFSGVGNRDVDSRFQEVSGLSAEITTEELTVGGENRFSYRLPGRAKYSNLVLKRGMIKDSALIKWFKDAVENFEFKPADVTVTLLNENHEATVSWTFIQAYPVKWTTSDFKAMDNAIVLETIELAYQYFRRN